MHAIVPPHPGPFAAIEVLEANIGITLLVGTPIPSCRGTSAPISSPGDRTPVYVDIPEALFGAMNGGRDKDADRDAVDGVGGDEGVGAVGADGDGDAQRRRRRRPARPVLRDSARCVAASVRVDLGQTVLTVTTASSTRGQPGPSTSTLLGNTVRRPAHHRGRGHVRAGLRGRSMTDVSTIFDNALAPVAGHPDHRRRRHVRRRAAIHRHRGRIEQLALEPRNVSDPAGFRHRPVASRCTGLGDGGHDHRRPRWCGRRGGEPSSFHLTLFVVAVAAGATVLSHVNDAGFWLVKEYFGMNVVDPQVVVDHGDDARPHRIGDRADPRDLHMTRLRRQPLTT